VHEKKKKLSCLYLIVDVFERFREKNKRWAEQGSAIVCLHYLKVYDVDYLKINGILG